MKYKDLIKHFQYNRSNFVFLMKVNQVTCCAFVAQRSHAPPRMHHGLNICDDTYIKDPIAKDTNSKQKAKDGARVQAKAIHNQADNHGC